jgi:multicomponent Na+:H+ antiporter subunit E
VSGRNLNTEEIDDPPPSARGAAGRRFIRTTLVLAVVWLGLNGPDAGSWLVGIPSIALGAWAATRFPTRPFVPIRVPGLPSFAATFLHQSVLGGWDVALRVLNPSLPIRPGHVVFTTRLPEGPPRHLMLSTIGLLPGTLSTALEGDRIEVHALDTRSDVEAELRHLERRVAGLFSGIGDAPG